MRWCALAIALVALGLPAAAARAQAIEPRVRAVVTLRALAYERSLAAGTGDLRLAVVVGGSGGEARDGRAMQAAFAGLARRVRVAGRRLRVTTIQHESTRATLRAIRASRADVVYVPAGLDSAIGELGGPVGADRRIMVCGDPDGVGLGCLLSVERHRRAMRVVVHLRLADRIGKRFDARLLRLSRIVR